MVCERKVVDIEVMLQWGMGDGWPGSFDFVFGHGPLRCVAASWAPMAAAAISGTIMAHLERETIY